MTPEVALALALPVTVLGHKLLAIWGDRRTRRWADVDGLQSEVDRMRQAFAAHREEHDDTDERLQTLESAWEIKRGGM